MSVTFEYSDILREPASYVLRTFDAGASGLVAIWYGFTLTAVLFIPLVVLVDKALARQDTPYMAVATTFGVIAGVVQFLGLIRWPFLDVCCVVGEYGSVLKKKGPEPIRAWPLLLGHLRTRIASGPGTRSIGSLRQRCHPGLTARLDVLIDPEEVLRVPLVL